MAGQDVFGRKSPPPRLVRISDLPTYPDEAVAIVENVIAELPPHKLLLTYRDISASFGLSRSTIWRRIQEGLVPGVMISHGRVVQDCAVRRLDRTQLKWLLLAVRFPQRG